MRQHRQQFPLVKSAHGSGITPKRNSLPYERNSVMEQRRFFNRSLCGIAAMAALVLAFGIFPAGSFAQAPTPTTPVKIGTIGSGNIGSTLGTLWIKSGHPVLFSSRHPEQLKPLVDGLGPRSGRYGKRSVNIRRRSFDGRAVRRVPADRQGLR